MSKDKITWHAEIVHFPAVTLKENIRDRDKYTDFCSYSRMFLWKLLFVIPMTAIIIGSYLGFYLNGWLVIAATILGDVPWVGLKFFMGGNFAWVFTHGIVAVLLILVHITMYHNYKKEKILELERDPSYKAKPQGLISLWYSKLKHKICPKMDY